MRVVLQPGLASLAATGDSVILVAIGGWFVYQIAYPHFQRGAWGFTAMYALLFSLVEQVTPLPALGITLAISDAYAGPSLAIPGFLGDLDAAGAATVTLPIPNDPTLAGLRVPLQAIANAPPFIVSNLVRVTVQQRGTFRFVEELRVAGRRIDVIEGSLKLTTPVAAVKSNPVTGAKEIINLGRV